MIYFFYSGLLLSFVLLSKLQKSEGRFNFINYVLFRYLRLIIPIMGSIAIIFITRPFFDGPMAQLYQIHVDQCKETWQNQVFLLENYKTHYGKHTYIHVSY